MSVPLGNYGQTKPGDFLHLPFFVLSFPSSPRATTRTTIHPLHLHTNRVISKPFAMTSSNTPKKAPVKRGRPATGFDKNHQFLLRCLTQSGVRVSYQSSHLIPSLCLMCYRLTTLPLANAKVSRRNRPDAVSIG
jgi:hypothetical protein